MLVTGVVVAVKGRIDDVGEFVVSDWAFSFDVQDADSEKVANDEPGDLAALSPNPTDKFVMFVSGMNIGSCGDNEVHDLSVQLLGDFIGGRLGDPGLSSLASHITRLVVAGNSISQSDASALKDRFNTQKQKGSSVSTPSKQVRLLTFVRLSAI
jgi:DNA polymerase delta subunit 2